MHGNGEDTTDNEQCIKISNATLPYLEHLHKLLLDPPYVRAASKSFLKIKVLPSVIFYFILFHNIFIQKPAVKTTVGLLECPLGNTRLHVAKLLSALLATENLKIHESLENLGTFQTLLVRSRYMSIFNMIFYYHQVLCIILLLLFTSSSSKYVAGSVFQIYME